MYTCIPSFCCLPHSIGDGSKGLATHKGQFPKTLFTRPIPTRGESSWSLSLGGNDPGLPLRAIGQERHSHLGARGQEPHSLPGTCKFCAGDNTVFCLELGGRLHSGPPGLCASCPPHAAPLVQCTIRVLVPCMFYPAPIGQRSIVMSVSVCLSAIVSSELHVRFSANFFFMLLMAVSRSSSGGVVIRYVLPLCLLISQGCLTSPPS